MSDAKMSIIKSIKFTLIIRKIFDLKKQKLASCRGK